MACQLAALTEDRNGRTGGDFAYPPTAAPLDGGVGEEWVGSGKRRANLTISDNLPATNENNQKIFRV
jgi:hypothetical protein